MHRAARAASRGAGPASRGPWYGSRIANRRKAMPNTLLLILLLLAASVVVVGFFRSVGLPPIQAYLIVGIALGPHALAVVPDIDATRELAEFGIVFLMFSI